MSRRRFQHPKGLKGGKRPRSWHRGRAQGKVNDRLLRSLEPVLEHVDAELEQTARARRRPNQRVMRQERARDRAETTALVRAIEHLAPTALAPWPASL